MYRILSPTAILGYGFPVESFKSALKQEIDLIAVDAGSMDAGPYYLGANSQYVGEFALRRDLGLMIEAALEKQCLLVIGSAGFSGGDTQLLGTLEIVKEIVEQLGADEVRVACTSSGVSGEAILEAGLELNPLGTMPELGRETILESEIVAQMGIEPIITAIENDAQIVVCGRAYDPAVFAADAINRGFPAGVCYHAAKILECGAIACEPGSGSDCLIAELTKKGRASFHASNEERSATVKSIAAHTLYEKSRPDLFSLPGGVLDIRNARFTQVDVKTASLEGSQFIRKPYSVKLEGSRNVGKRLVSILPLTTVDGVDEDLRIYGRNGVEDCESTPPIEELGLVVVAKGDDPNAVKDALSFIRSTLLHFGYKGRVSTAGNLAFPFSPSDFNLDEKEGEFRSLFVAGSRDPFFQREFTAIRESVLAALKAQHSDLYRNTEIEFVVGDSKRPLAILETVERSKAEAERVHLKNGERLRHLIDSERESFCGIEAGNAYVWSIHHLIEDIDFIRNLFPVQLLDYKEGKWIEGPTLRAEYESLEEDNEGVSEVEGKFHELTFMATEWVASEVDSDAVPLQEMARVIRSKNAGINEITFDILFNSEVEYEKALSSGAFNPSAIASFMRMDRDELLGCFRFDPALAIKLTFRRGHLCGSPGERDTFGAQQHSKLLAMEV